MSAEREQRVVEVLDALRRIMVHYGLWFAEAVHHCGLDTALAMEREAGDRWRDILLGRLAKTLDLPLEHGLPKALLDLPPERLEALHEALAASWLACDGVFFQAAEAHTPTGLTDAKRINDTCWSRFSPFEAARIRELLRLPLARDAREGLAQLRQALGARLYARLNVQEVVDEGATGFTFRMCRCRVQDARRRKGLEDYPCKSGGLVEYTTFARAFHPDLRTECLACPPDPHPAEWYCAWRFSSAD